MISYKNNLLLFLPDIIPRKIGPVILLYSISFYYENIQLKPRDFHSAIYFAIQNSIKMTFCNMFANSQQYEYVVQYA